MRSRAPRAGSSRRGTCVTPFHRKPRLTWLANSASRMRYCCRAPALPVSQLSSPPRLTSATRSRRARYAGGQRCGGAHRGVECALGLREGVEEQDDVGAVLGVLDVHVGRAAARGRAPVDAADAVARRQRAEVGELDALAQLARDLAAEDGPGPERGDERAQPLDAGVHAQLGSLADRPVERRRPEPVARADDRRADVVDAPVGGRSARTAAHVARRLRARTRSASGRCRAVRRPAGGRRRVHRRRGSRSRASRAASRPSSVRSRSSRSSPSSASGRPASATRDEEHERRGEHRGLRASRDQGGHERRRRKRRVDAQPRRRRPGHGDPHGRRRAPRRGSRAPRPRPARAGSTARVAA